MLYESLDIKLLLKCINTRLIYELRRTLSPAMHRVSTPAQGSLLTTVPDWLNRSSKGV